MDHIHMKNISLPEGQGDREVHWEETTGRDVNRSMDQSQ